MIGDALADFLGRLVAPAARFLVVMVATVAFTALGVILIAAGVFSLLGISPGDVLKLTPPGRVGAAAEIVAGGS